MRLSTSHAAQIIQALDADLQSTASSLYLFGSRTRNDLKGGDIDLLIVVADTAFAEVLLNKKHVLLARIKKHIGEQKIDLKIATEGEIETDSFLKIIKPTAVLLQQWKPCY